MVGTGLVALIIIKSRGWRSCGRPGMDHGTFELAAFQSANDQLRASTSACHRLLLLLRRAPSSARDWNDRVFVFVVIFWPLTGPQFCVCKET